MALRFDKMISGYGFFCWPEWMIEGTNGANIILFDTFYYKFYILLHSEGSMHTCFICWILPAIPVVFIHHFPAIQYVFTICCVQTHQVCLQVVEVKAIYNRCKNFWARTTPWRPHSKSDIGETWKSFATGRKTRV